MNYTRPHSLETQDRPSDWLNSALLFARSLSIILKETEGIVIDIKGDVNIKEMLGNEQIEKVFVYKKEGMVHILPCEDDIPEGTMIWMHGNEFELN